MSAQPELAAGRPLAPDPILDALDRYRGAFVDLDRSYRVEADALRRTVDELTGELNRFGVEPAARVLVAIGNGPMFVAAVAATLRAEACPLLVHADTPALELRRTAERFRAPFAITNALAESELAPAGFSGRGCSPAPWATGFMAHLPGGEMPLEPSLHGVPLHPTSGTTGVPKLAARPATAAVEEARHYIETMQIDPSDVVLCTVPMSHAYGFGMCAMVPLVSGASVAAMRRFNAGRALAALSSSGITIYPAAPAALHLLLMEAKGSADPELPVVPRVITSAGAPLPERTATAVSRRWGTTVRPLYGTTETGGISVAGPDHDPASSASVGPAMQGVQVQIRPEAETGGLNEDVGRLWVSSPSMMAGYAGDAGIDPGPLPDGWFETGDLAHLDASGNILLHGRACEVINVFGMKVLPGEVEEVIALLPQVSEVKVYGAVNRWRSMSVRAAIVASDDLTEADVRRHCRQHLVTYKRPETIVRLERLPRSPAGKIVASELP